MGQIIAQRGIRSGVHERDEPDPAVLRWFLCAILLCFLTIMLMGQLPRATALGPVQKITFEPDASGLPRGWLIDGAVTAGDGSLRLQADAQNPNAIARLVLPLSPDELAIEVALEARVTGVQPGDQPWERARLLLTGRDRDGRMLATRSDDLVRSAGSGGWQRFAGTLLLPPGAVDGLVVARLQKAPGLFEIRGLTLQPMGEWLGHTLLLWGTAAAWALLLLWGAGLVQARLQPSSVAVLGLVVLGTVVLLLIPHEWRQRVLIEGASLAGWRVGTEMVAKLGHFAIFAALAFLARLLAPRTAAGLQLALLVLLAGIGEVLQYLAADRSPGLKDWAINSGGVLTGFVAGSILLAGWQLIDRRGRRHQLENS